MGESAEDKLKEMLSDLQDEQKTGPSRHRAVLITELEKVWAWAKAFEL